MPASEQVTGANSAAKAASGSGALPEGRVTGGDARSTAPAAIAHPAPLTESGSPAGYAPLLIAAAVSAIAFVAAFPPVNFWPAIFFAPAALAWVALSASSTRAALLVTAIAHFALWLWFGRWLVQITAAGYPFYAAYLTLYPVLFVWVIRRVHTARPLANYATSLPFAITIPVIWTGIETLRGELAFKGYPWFLIAHPLVEAPELVQSADLGGTYLISFLAAMISGAMLDVLRRRFSMISGRRMAVILAAVFAVHAANIGYGMWRMNQPDLLEAGPTMLTIQTNMPQDNKMRASIEERTEYMREFILSTVGAYMQIREQDQDVDLVIWPETMVFGFGFEPETLDFLVENDYFPRDDFYRELRAFVEQSGTPMLVGSPAYLMLSVKDNQRYEWDELYNSVYLLDGPPPHQRYDKHFLTPFGETMPYISNWPWLEERLLSLGAKGMTFDLGFGTGHNRLALTWRERGLQLATPICFEVTMSRTCRKLAGAGSDEQADIFINLSNDGWFGWYEAGRQQHAQIARFRCIENRVPMVRSVNTGLSMSIDSLGRITGAVGEGRYGAGGQAGALVARVPLDRRRPFYATIGNSFAWIMLVMTALSTAITFTRRQGLHAP